MADGTASEPQTPSSSGTGTVSLVHRHVVDVHAMCERHQDELGELSRALEDISSRLRVLEVRVQQSDARLSWLESFVRRFRSAFHALFP